MILVEDLIKVLQKDVVVIIDEGPDDYNCGKLHPYHKKEDSARIIEEIFFVEDKCIGVRVL